MKKQIFSFALVITIMISLFIALPITANAETYGVFTYSVENGEVTITDCEASTTGDIEIPDTIEDCPVTAIGSYAFDGCEKITSIAIPDSVSNIGDYAFRSCINLTNIKIPDGVTHIGSYLFSDCDALINVTLPNTVTTIGDHAFYSCDNLSGISIPDGVTSIGEKAFVGSSIAGITIPNSVASMGKEAFYSSGDLTDVIIAANITSIKNRSFMYCISLKNVTIPTSVTNIEAYAFKRCDSLTDVYYAGTEEEWNSVTIDSNNDSLLEATIHFGEPAPALSIYIYTVENCKVTINGCDKNISGAIEIPKKIGGYPVTAIGSYAFDGCENLTSVTIPNGVTSIEKRAFSFCTGLTDITIPDSVTSIDEQAFYKCTGLTDITIPGSVTDIGPCAFEECKSLANLTISDGVTNIGMAAFVNCDSLENIYIPDSVLSIGKDAFSGCESLTNIGVDESNPNYSSKDGVLFDKDKTQLIQYPKGKSDTIYNIPEGVTNIKDMAFSCCNTLTNITISENVESIGEDAFSWCTNLTDITIPTNVTSIGDFAFYGCDSLTDVYYGGTENEWNAIEIGEKNEDLENATIHFKEDAFLKRDLAKLISDTYGLLTDFSIGESPFPDIDESDPNYEEILACEKAGIMDGNDDGTFSPDNSVTNCELAGYLYRTLSYIDYPMEVPDDAEYDKTKWYGKFAWIMENLGVMENVSDWEATATSDSIGQSFYSIGEEYCARIRKGDANENHTVEVKDVISIRRFITGGYGTIINEWAANVNNDEIIDVKDVILIRRFITGGYGVEL